MLKYHVAVCDDEKSDLDGIVQSVQRYDVQGCFDIETYMDGNELLSELQMQKKSFDLLLLDIEMPSNGFQLAQSLIQIVAEQCWSKLKPAANAITFWIRHFIVAALIGSMVRKPAPLTTWKPVFCMKLSLLTFRHTQRPLWATETPLCEKLQTRCTFGYLLTGRSTSGN